MNSEMQKMNLSREMSMLLSLSRVSPGPSVLDHAAAMIDSDLDWEALMEMSARHGTANLIYSNLSGLENIPERILNRFRNIYNNTLRSNVQLAAEADRLVDGLNSRGIDVIALKGPVTSEVIFGNIGIYPSEDIDILVKIRDLDSTRHFLEAEGYILTDKGFDEYREFFLEELYHLRFSNNRYVIEPHWNLFFRYFTATREFWWEDSIPVSSGGRSYTFLSPEKNILYNSFRYYSKAFSQLRFLVMVAEILRYYKDDIDWDKLFHYAYGHKFENVLRVTMKLSSDLLGAPVPDGYKEIRGFIPGVLYKYIQRIVLKGDNHHPLNKIVMSMLIDDVSGVFKVLFRRLFPSRGEIVMRYGLQAHSVKSLIYYILNPLFLVLHRHQKV
jgi:hypothetical protein